ncbi:MAG: hypothetical protein ACKO45_05900 [Cyanobium sp.]
MPASPESPPSKGLPNSMDVMVVGCGLEAAFRAPDGVTEQATRRLARRLRLPHRPITDPRSPHLQLRLLHQSQTGWLASLPLDPGQALADGSNWAEALGAWHQPTLLVVAASQHPSGVAASTTALLRQWQVPLLGLVQWGGAWNRDLRRRDGLPWLGRLEDAAAEGDSDSPLAALLTRRWALLDLPWQAPGLQLERLVPMA